MTDSKRKANSQVVGLVFGEFLDAEKESFGTEKIDSLSSVMQASEEPFLSRNRPNLTLTASSMFPTLAHGKARAHLNCWSGIYALAPRAVSGVLWRPMTANRRIFLKSSLAAAAWAASSGAARALAPASRPYPIGLQLFTVRNQMPKDFEGTLAKVAAIGYTEVEAAGFFGHPAAAVKRMMVQAGLKCVSAHYSLPSLLKATPQTIDYAKTLGLSYVVCSSPWSPHPEHLLKYPGGAWAGLQQAMTLDDWKWSAEQLQRIGEQFHKAGIQLAYHTHTMSFKKHGNTTGFELLLRDTSLRMVALELDCGWAVAAGQNPVQLLHTYPKRIQMLHLKDMKKMPPGTPPWKYIPTELGRGTINYQPILRAAMHTAVKHVFIEQDDIDVPIWEALRIDYRYMSRIDHA